MTQLIPQNVVEPSEILKILQNYIESKPDNQRWLDQYSGSAGQTLLELIAALGGFDSFQRIMHRRELSLDACVADSSIREHAFNRGVITSTSDTLTLRLDFLNATPIKISKGQLIGQIGDYSLYSMESKETSLNFSLDVAAGRPYEKTLNFTPTKFSTLTFLTNDKLVANALESFTANGISLSLRSELSFKEKYSNGFLLRRVVPGEVRIYIGNGVLGWYSKDIQTVTYSCLTYDETLTSVIDMEPDIFISPALNKKEVLTFPSFAVDGETLRSTAIYYPLDGRIVQDTDYDGVILAHFGGVIHDAYSYNVDPDQIVRLIPSVNYEEKQLEPIKALVDSRRGLGINVVYTVMPLSSGKVLPLTLTCADFIAYAAMSVEIIGYIRRNTLRFMRVATQIRATDIASDLTHRFGIKFYGDPSQIYSLNPTDFIIDYTLQVTT